jgi:hypothetical protein
MAIPDRYLQRNAWPHVFAKTKITKDGPRGLANKHICFHCQMEWWDKNPRPIGLCPARNDKREHKRLGVD